MPNEYARVESVAYYSNLWCRGSFMSQMADRNPCVVLVPVNGVVEPACEDGLRELERRGYVVRRVRGYAAIDQGRCQMATDALADGFTETMWIDADIGFRPEDVERLRSHKLPLVSAIYPKKGRREVACHVLPGTDKLVFGQEGGLVELLYAATGFLHVRREVYVAMQEQLHLPLCNGEFAGRPLCPYFQPMVRPHGQGYWYLAEDFAFCERARQCRFRIFADSTVRLRHYGAYGFTWEDAGIEPPRFGTFHFHLKDPNPGEQ